MHWVAPSGKHAASGTLEKRLQADDDVLPLDSGLNSQLSNLWTRDLQLPRLLAQAELTTN